MNKGKFFRSLAGVRRDSEVMYMDMYDTQSQHIGRRRRISDVWGTLSKSQSTPDLLGERIYDEEQENKEEKDLNVARDTVFFQEPASIFNRPGFGSVAFRRTVSPLLLTVRNQYTLFVIICFLWVTWPQNKSKKFIHLRCTWETTYNFRIQITSTFDNLPITQTDTQVQNCNVSANNSMNGSVNSNKFSPNGHNEEISIGSAGSLARRQSLWDEDFLSGKLNLYLFTNWKVYIFAIMFYCVNQAAIISKLTIYCVKYMYMYKKKATRRTKNGHPCKDS